MSVKRATGRVRTAASSGIVILGAALAVAIGATDLMSRVAARGGQQPAEANGIAPEALAQIQALLAEINAGDSSIVPAVYSAAAAQSLKAATFDRAALGARGLPYERLDQLTIDLLLGAA